MSVIRSITALGYVTLILITILPALGCAMVDSRRAADIWTAVRADNPGCPEVMPKVVWLSEPIYLEKDGKAVFAYGAYVKDCNTVVLEKFWADEDVLMHEFEHACGDRLGEKPARFSDPSMFYKVLVRQPE
jgi:hypothetical protein